MKKISAKNIKIILLVVLLISAAAAAFWGGYYYIPYRWEQKLNQKFLVHHQTAFRADSLRHTGFSTFMMNNLELGTDGKELLTSPRAELHLANDIFNSSGVPGFESLELFDCPIVISGDKNNIIINGYKFDDFVQGLMNLPKAPDGRPITLHIHALIKLGNESVQPTFLEIKTATHRYLNIAARWANGSWNARLDFPGKIMTVAFSGAVNTRLWQEMMLRSGLPAPAVRLLPKAKITGNGQFSAVLPKLSINNFTCRGAISEANLNWYGQQISNVAPFEFEVDKDAPHITFSIPELTLTNPTPAKFKNVKLLYHLKQDMVKLTTKSDLRQLLVSFFCRSLHAPAIAVSSQNSELSGHWNTRTGRWRLQATPLKKETAALEVDATAGTRLIMTPGIGDFEAQGTGQNGQMLHNFDFTKMELHNSYGVSRVDKGKVFVKINFGTGNPVSEDSIEFSFANFTADYKKIQLEIPGLAGEFNLRSTENSRREIYLILRGLASSFICKNWKAQLDSFQGTFNMESLSDLTSWKISGFDLTTPSATAEIARQTHSLKNAALRGEGAIQSALFQTARVMFRADDVSGNKYKLVKPRLDIDYAASRPAAQRYKSIFSVQRALLPSNQWDIHTFDNGQAQFHTSTLSAAPDNIDLKADALQFKNNKLTADLQRAAVKIKPHSPTRFTGEISYAFMLLNTVKPLLGKGSFSDGKISAEWQHDHHKKLQKYAVKFSSGQPAWQYDSLQTGGRSCTAQIDYDHLKTPALQGVLTMEQPTLLGKYFSAIGKKLTNRFSGTGSGCTGVIDFVDAVLSSPNGEIELKGSELTLPWQTAKALPKQLPEGKLTAKQLYYKRQPEGAVSAVIQQGMLLNSDSSLLSNTLKIRGELAAEKFNKRPFKFSTVWQLPPSENAMAWEFELPESQLVLPMDLSSYLNLPCPVQALKGNFAMSGKIKRQGNSPVQSTIKLTAINSDWQLGSLTAEGVTTTAQIDTYDNKNILLPHNISASRLIWEKWIFEENDLHLNTNAAGQLQLAGWQGRFGSGTFNLSQVVTLNKLQNSAQGLTVPMALFEVQNIPGENFFRSIGIKYLSGNMPLSGQLRPRLQQGKLYFDRSSLSSRTPAGSLMKLELPSADMLRVRNKAYQAFALAVLKAMKCTQTQFDFTSTADEIAMQVKAEGEPAAPVPFVYKGGNPPFRPADRGEEGFADEIELNINLKLRPEQPGA